jgi:hypothetical protein
MVEEAAHLMAARKQRESKEGLSSNVTTANKTKANKQNQHLFISFLLLHNVLIQYSVA